MRPTQVQIPVRANLHQLWQAVILKPFKLEECILHFWKLPIFINLVLAGQDHTYVLNALKAFLKIASFITVYLVAQVRLKYL